MGPKGTSGKVPSRDRHRLAEERSLAYHRAVARRLEEDPRQLDVVRRRLDEWIAEGGRSAAYALEWRRIVDRPLSELRAVMVDPGERATALRQATPFADLLDPRERWQIWAEVRREFEKRPGFELSSDAEHGR